MQLVGLLVVGGQPVSWALKEAEELRSGVKEVDELREKKPMANYGNASYVNRSLPQMAATAKMMPAK